MTAASQTLPLSARDTVPQAPVRVVVMGVAGCGKSAVGRLIAEQLALPLVEGRFSSKLVDARQIHVDVDADRAFVPIARIGGDRGWYFATWLWRIRGVIDLLMGGVGMRRGRRDPNAPAVGDTLDFWRIEAYEPGRRLRLAAEMKMPGRA